MPSKKRDEGPQEYNHEERQTRHPRRMSDLWHQDVQNRKGLTSTSLNTDPEQVGLSKCSTPKGSGSVAIDGLASKGSPGIKNSVKVVA
jgi:hypothetical protein